MVRATIILTVFLFSIIIESCQNSTPSIFPVLYFDEGENKHFIYTNKNSGFLVGNSHKMNSSEWEGWYIDSAQYLLDYQLYRGSRNIRRDSIKNFTFYPFSATRIYASGLNETFTLLDSINAIIWEYEAEFSLSDLQFEPITKQQGKIGSNHLSMRNPRIIIPPDSKDNSSTKGANSWLGFNYFVENKHRIIIIAAAENNREKLEKTLDILSKNYSWYIHERSNRMSTVLQQNQTYTNIPEITEAVKWAQLSLDALIKKKDPTGIQAGLPGDAEFLGRHTFSSMTGALLINGQFQIAKKILTEFGAYQLKNEDDTWLGRIPNKITRTGIDYNAADITWWYIRALYEYFLFSGDKEYARYIFPVVKRAINGAIRFRIDERFYLTHKGTETWMSHSDPGLQLTSRGTRAVEIQSLWYTALMIGSKLAAWNDEPNLAEYWLVIAQGLKKNFNSDFWNSYRNSMYDHFENNRSSGKSIRPNTLFAGFSSYLTGIPALIEDDIKVKVTHTVLNKLTYRYGVGTLWQKDNKFNPGLFGQRNDFQRINRYNGTIWHWLSGPLITNLLSFNMDEIAFYLYSYESNQILYEDAIGNFASFRNAKPVSPEEFTVIEKNLSSSISLAEFARNFYQDFIGYHPNGIENEIFFNPVFPSELKYVTTILPFNRGSIHFKYFEDDNLFKFEISKKGEIEEVEINFTYPGFDGKQLKLDKITSSVQFNLDPALQRSYIRYGELDWHFAQWEY